MDYFFGTCLSESEFEKEKQKSFDMYNINNYMNSIIDTKIAILPLELIHLIYTYRYNSSCKLHEFINYIHEYCNKDIIVVFRALQFLNGTLKC